LKTRRNESEHKKKKARNRNKMRAVCHNLTDTFPNGANYVPVVCDQCTCYSGRVCRACLAG
jgi:hypothetical protein